MRSMGIYWVSAVDLPAPNPFFLMTRMQLCDGARWVFTKDNAIAPGLTLRGGYAEISLA